jgi:hypothetical protein
VVHTGAAQLPWPCGEQKPVEPCVKRHGRFSSQNGRPYTIWIVGTTRRIDVANGHEALPVAQKYLEMTSENHSYIFGDFDICPLEPDVPGHMRSACVVGAERLVVQPLRRERPPFRLLSTWPDARR